MTSKVEDGKTPRFDNQIVLPDNVTGLTVNSSTANTYGVYVVFSADIGDLDMYLNEILGSQTGIDKRVQFEIGIGAGGSEVVIAQGVMRLLNAINEVGRILFNNVRVPAGSRIAIRVRDDNASVFSYETHLSLNS